MSVVIVGGNERMAAQYEGICKEHGCKAKVFTKENGSLKRKLGSPDLLILFISTVSHKMVISVTQEAKKNQIPVARIHTSSGRPPVKRHGRRAGRRGSGQPGEELRHSGPASGALPGGILRPHIGGHQNGQHVLHPPGRRGLSGSPSGPVGRGAPGKGALPADAAAPGG